MKHPPNERGNTQITINAHSPVTKNDPSLTVSKLNLARRLNITTDSGVYTFGTPKIDFVRKISVDLTTQAHRSFEAGIIVKISCGNRIDGAPAKYVYLI